MTLEFKPEQEQLIHQAIQAGLIQHAEVGSSPRLGMVLNLVVAVLLVMHYNMYIRRALRMEPSEEQNESERT